MVNFIKIILKRNNKIFENIKYIPEVFELYKKYGLYMYDDYFSKSNEDLLDKVIDLIENVSPYFWIIIDKKSTKVAGFAFLSNIVGAGKNYHSAEITTCFKQEFWGDFTKSTAKKFIKYCFKKYGFEKLKASIFQNNMRVRMLLQLSGFKKEATLRGETLKNGELQDIEIYSILRKKEVKNEH